MCNLMHRFEIRLQHAHGIFHFCFISCLDHFIMQNVLIRVDFHQYFQHLLCFCMCKYTYALDNT